MKEIENLYSNFALMDWPDFNPQALLFMWHDKTFKSQS